MNPDNPTPTASFAKATQPKGEWTAGQLYDTYKSYHNARDAWNAIADSINAALAVAYEKGKLDALKPNSQ